jgi:hypothetical protein
MGIDAQHDYVEDHHAGAARSQERARLVRKVEYPVGSALVTGRDPNPARTARVPSPGRPLLSGPWTRGGNVVRRITAR